MCTAERHRTAPLRPHPPCQRPLPHPSSPQLSGAGGGHRRGSTGSARAARPCPGAPPEEQERGEQGVRPAPPPRFISIGDAASAAPTPIPGGCRQGFPEVSGHLRAALPVPEPGQGSALRCPRPRRAAGSVQDKSAGGRGSFRAGQRRQRGERRSSRPGAPAAVGDAYGSREAPGEPAQVEREQLVGAGAGGGREKVEKRAGTGGDGGAAEGGDGEGGSSSSCASVPRPPARRLKHRALLPEVGGASAALGTAATRRSRAFLRGFAVQLLGKVAVRGQRLSAR